MINEDEKMWWLKNIKKSFFIKNKEISRIISLIIITSILISSLSTIFVLYVGADDGSMAFDVDFLKDNYPTKTTIIDPEPTMEPTTEPVIEPAATPTTESKKTSPTTDFKKDLINSTIPSSKYLRKIFYLNLIIF